MTGRRTRTGAADKIRAGKMTGDGVPRITKLDDTNYLQWSTEIEHLMRFRRTNTSDPPARRRHLGIRAPLAASPGPESLPAHRVRCR